MKAHRIAWASRTLHPSRQVDSAAEWLARQPWGLWCSLTFRELPNEHEAMHAFRMWLRSIARALRTHVTFAYGASFQGMSGSHFHALLAAAGVVLAPEVRRTIDSLWRGKHGFARVGRYKPDAGGERYLLEHDHWDRGVACPRTQPRCRRRRGCAEDVGPWT